MTGIDEPTGSDVEKPSSCELSIVSPVYLAEEIVEVLVSRIESELAKLPQVSSYEIILVEDGSPDGSWQAIVASSKRHPHVRGIKLSRNFGQHAAIEAGLSLARGDFVAVMDCDLQEDPVYLGPMLEEALAGADVVMTRRHSRQFAAGKNLAARAFKCVIDFLLPKDGHIDYSLNVGTLSLVSRKVITAFLEVRDFHKPYTAILGWLGFRPVWVEIEHKERFAGKSSYSLTKSIFHALNGIIVYSERPLYLSVTLGMIFITISGLYGLYIVISRLLFDTPVHGWASLITAVVFTNGLILMNLGIVALYIGKVFQQAKMRPRYVVDKQVSSNAHET